MRRFTIARHAEEGSCEHCGYPLYVGDSAVLSGDERFACSRSCAASLDKAGEQDTWHEGCEDSEPGRYGYVPA